MMSASEKRANELKIKTRAYEKACINEWALRYIDFLEKKKHEKEQKDTLSFQKMLDDARVQKPFLNMDKAKSRARRMGAKQQTNISQSQEAMKKPPGRPKGSTKEVGKEDWASSFTPSAEIRTIRNNYKYAILRIIVVVCFFLCCVCLLVDV